MQICIDFCCKLCATGSKMLLKSVYWERLYPLLISILLLLLVIIFDLNPTYNDIQPVVNAGISIGAILLGFLGTAKALLLSLNSKKFLWLKSNKTAWKMLLKYLRSSFLFNIYFCIFSLMFIFISSKKLNFYGYDLNEWLTFFWLFLFLMSFLTFYRFINILFNLLSYENEAIDNKNNS